MGKKILFTGPESTGKTALSSWAATQWNGTYLVEQARGYLEGLDRTYLIEDLLEIANLQRKKEEEAFEGGNQDFVFSDTSMLVIHLWMTVRFGVPLWNQGTFIDAMYEFDQIYLCQPDFGWVKDPLRENPTNTIELFLMYEEELRKLNLSFIVLEGALAQRKQKIISTLIVPHANY